MVILLKSACLIIWLAVMLALILGSKRGNSRTYNEVSLYIDNEEDIEAMVRRILSHLGPGDRLVIHDSSRVFTRLHRVTIRKLLRENPSILYHTNVPEA